ncbi:piggyBac transposable element-derived protein 2-like [Onthophagus taurus]|uniref:piggyBac transposable element-derived protein 2-like n=1 Tax=Onthophagus taurus TaxID=166361 RepID=UPI0039BE4F68
MSRFLTKRKLDASLEEIVNELEIERKGAVVDAVYIPPPVDYLTDEECIDDENLTSMNCPQDIDIAGTYEVQVPNADEYNSSDDEFLAVKQRRLMKEKENRFDIKWKKSQIDYTHSALSIESLDDVLQEKLVEKTPLELFFLYFDDEMLNLIINFSLKYAHDNNRPNFRLDKEQLLKFLDIVLLSGYHTLPTIPMFWSNEEEYI